MKLLVSAIQSGVKLAALPFFRRRKIERRVEDATSEVIEAIFPYLLNEGISEERQRLLLETCVAELKPLSENPEALFRGSLNGQKIFEDLYRDRELPEVIREEGLRDSYAMICPRIAELLCRIPAAVKDWEMEAWSESFRRLDDIGQQLRSLFVQVDELVDQPLRRAGGTLSTVRRALAQKVGLDLDLTGLRSDSPIAAKFADLFVHPEISDVLEEKGQPRPISVGQADGAFKVFSHRDRQAIVIGPPGAGKSTWSKWLQSEALSPRWTGIAVRAELRQLATGELPSIQDLVRSVVGKHFAEELTQNILNSWFWEGRVLFILDGFDEIRPSERDGVIAWIAELVAVARSCPFVLTSRPLTTDHLIRLSGTWKIWNIEAFDKARVVGYIGRWYRFAPLLTDAKREVDCGSLAQGWLADPTLGPLTGNPLLLSTLLTVHHLDGRLPSGRSQLYKRYVDGMLGLWDDRRKVAASDVSLTLEQKRRVFRSMALHLFLSERDQIDEPELVEWLGKHLTDEKISATSVELLAAFRERSGLIIGPGIYSFVHKSIGEYLVAETILQGDQSDKGGRLDRFRLFEFRADDRWNTVTFLWAGLSPVADLERFIEACLEAGDWPLACGLLLDQTDRLPNEIRRSLTIRSIAVINHNSRVSVTNFLIIAMGPDHIHMDSTLLRGIGSGHVSLWAFFSKAVSVGDLLFSDLSVIDGALKWVVWTCLAYEISDDLVSWSENLRNLIMVGGIDSQILAFQIGDAMIVDRGQRLHKLIAVFQDKLPEHSGMLPLAMMAAFVRLRRGDVEYGLGERILKELARGVFGVPASEILEKTRSWEIYGHLDLLQSFIVDVGKAYENHQDEGHEILEAVLSYANTLVGLRG